VTATEVFLAHVPGIAEALERCGDVRTVEDVVEAIQNRRAQVWGDERGIIITQLTPPYVHFWIATGEKEFVIERSREIMQWAKALGFTKATLTGRRGWVRALAHDGWTERAVLMERNLNEDGQG
jgi:hypothetical protein